MRSENEDRCLVPQSKPEETTPEYQKTLKFAYTRDFLFSLAEFDTCKKLPTGFDSSILRELGNQSTSVLHSYHDSDAGRFQSSPSLCAWRNAEQGLLGSGVFARVHRGVAETSDPVLKGSGFHILNRSSEPYRPPHLCKAKNYSVRESEDHYNDETFGSCDNLSQERAEEEQRRRDSFELMRNEQEMATQEKQKIICDEHKETLNLDIAIIVEDSGVDKKVANKYSKSRGAKPYDVKEGHPENPVFCSSVLVHQFREGEKKTAADQKVNDHDSTKFSFGTNGIAHNLMKSASTPVSKESSMQLYGCCNPGAHSSHCLEESILSEINGRSSYDIEDSQSSCSNYGEAHQHFLLLLQKGAGLTDLAESSKLNMWSLYKPYVSETGNDNNQLNKSGRVFINNFEKNLREPISGTFVKDSQSTALSGTQKDLTSMYKGDDAVESQVRLPVGENCIIPLTVNGTGPIGDAEGITLSGFAKQTGVNKRNGNLLVSNIQAKVGLNLQGGPELKNSSLSSFDELDICLPDEDSLITADDYILQQDSMFMAAGDTSSTPVNIFGRLADCGVAVGEKRFDLAGFLRPTSFHSSHDLVSLDTPFKSLRMQQSYPQLQHSQLKQGKEQGSCSKSQESIKGLRIKPKNLKACPCNLQPLQHFPTNVHLTSYQHLRAAETGFDHSGNNQLPQELPIPGYFPPHQLYGLPRVAFPQHTSNEMVCYAQDQNAMLNSSLSFKQQCYRDLESVSSRHFEMGIESKADASSYYAWP
ncbi:hypothetical protein QUC31_008204 [Theobroma cacao]